ncbi:phosphatase PAP2 family protein [Terriglobus aquaticus]|uniref:Phosphatase PAP2 family protein n=1 Tax=Terriglobus aquaticus TaxID=940139 RepID=A0ABW9KNT4_9BACT|nr:phosphatase PAP2 family protein [Terriglobus aquaticus]
MKILKTLPVRLSIGTLLMAFAALGVSSIPTGCGKDISTTEPLPTQTFSNVDANAGSWKMIVLSGPSQIPVAAPAAVNSATYASEIAQIKSDQAALTDAQKSSITYWSSGGVLRWNEVMRELAAKSDLPPAPNSDGTYPVPSAANPFADPQYPFSNPPYAARAYSYVSVAQFEALKAAWYFKYLYKRPSPSAVDKSVQSLLPSSGIPSYPSEDAVEAGVNSVLLTLMFPTSVDEINAKTQEQLMVARISGRATQSDVDAGFALGKSVAAIFTARAGTDGMKAAGGTAAVWQAITDRTIATGQIAWISQDSPARPPMLPLFGQVKGWLMAPTDIVAVRPGPPPSTSSAQMKTETAEVKASVNNITGDQLATVLKWGDGASTPTPPGHWDTIAVPYIVKAGQSEVRAARTFALLNMALHDGAIACWDTKYFYDNPRPSQLDPSIKTQIALPNFPSYVSGHSVFSSAAATVLGSLFPDGASYFTQQAQEAGMSRLYAGIHYRSDITAGIQEGQQVGNYAVRFAATDGAN